MATSNGRGAAIPDALNGRRVPTMKIGLFAAVAAIVAAVTAATSVVAVRPAAAQDRMFSVATNAEPDVLDPAKSGSPQFFTALWNVYQSFTWQNRKGDMIPSLATSWDILDGGKVMIIHLRHGVTFQSGDPLTAEDVVWTYQRYLKYARFFVGIARYIKSVEAVDPHTVKFIFNQPDAEFLAIHPLLITSKAYYDRVGKAEFAKHPVGTGPYKVVKYVPGQYIDLEAYDKYWGPKPQIKKARFYFVGDAQTREAKLKAGEVDLLMDAPYPDVVPLEKAGFTITKLTCQPTTSIQFQLKNPHTPWHDLRVRQAIAYAIDKKAIIKGLLHGVPVHYPRLLPGEVGYDPNLKDYDYNPAKARALMKAAGYPNGFDMPFYVQTGMFFGMEETAEAITLYLKQNLNITTHTQGLGLAELIGKIFASGRDPTARFVAIGGYPIASLPTPLWGIGLAFYGKNPTALYDDTDIDALFGKAEATFDLKKQAPLISRIMSDEQKDLYIITLWDYVAVYAMKHDVTYTPGQRNLDILYLPWVHEKG
jgi:peptide/nickel transport system substrate-binding protein